MSKNKFGAYQIGQQVLFRDIFVTIIDKIKGNKTIKPNFQSGVRTGYESHPCLYLLDNRYKVKGDKLKKLKTL